MRAFEDYHPAVVFVCLLFCAGLAMFSVNPVILALSLLGALGLIISRSEPLRPGDIAFTTAVLIASPLLNALLSHNGVTVLFVLNNNPVTLEAILYGAAAGVMLVSVLFWFRSLSKIMTSSRMLCVFGGISPKLALLFSMTLRFVPLFAKQARIIDNAQRTLGLYNEDSIIDTVRGKLRVFSILVTWALENGVVTADSMSARGYATGRRTSFSIYRFRRDDAVLLALVLLFAALCTVGIALGATDYVYYPGVGELPCSPSALAVYIGYGALVLLPTFIETEEKLKWRCLKSKI